MYTVKRPGSENTAHLSGLDDDVSMKSPMTFASATTQMKPDITVNDYFMYLNVFVHNMPLTALLDSGSSINVMSKSYFKSVPHSEKMDFSLCREDLVLANNQSVAIYGTARIRVRKSLHDNGHFILVYILIDSSHPLILGTEYMKQHEILLDFSRCCSFLNVKKTTKVKCKATIVVQPNSECIVTALLDNIINIGMQGVCSGHSEVLNKGLLVSKVLVTCTKDHVVQIKLLNPGNETVHVNKGTILAKFELCDNSVDIVKLKSCAHINVDKETSFNVNDSQMYMYGKSTVDDVCLSDPSPMSEESNHEFDKFKSNFPVSGDLSPEEQTRLYHTLYKHRQVFTTEDNPDIGFTALVEHRITLKPDVVSKHQRPYRLPPDKREVLRHQLNELLRQGIIASVDEREDVPITSPIVRVAKRNKPKIDPNNVTKEQSLSSYRFCVDFRYLNTQTTDFRYTIPDLQELTESLADHYPQYMSFLDMSSGFFQIGISADTAKYTAFNTCFGTYIFLRLPMGLRQSPNVFQCSWIRF